MKDSQLINRRRFVKYVAGGTILAFGAGLATQAMGVQANELSCGSCVPIQGASSFCPCANGPTHNPFTGEPGCSCETA